MKSVRPVALTILTYKAWNSLFLKAMKKDVIFVLYKILQL